MKISRSEGLDESHTFFILIGTGKRKDGIPMRIANEIPDDHILEPRVSSYQHHLDVLARMHSVPVNAKFVLDKLGMVDIRFEDLDALTPAERKCCAEFYVDAMGMLFSPRHS